MTDSIILAQSVYASVAHRYWNGEWSHEKNLRVYGPDASHEGIGCNLRIEAAIQTTADAGDSPLGKTLVQLQALVDHQCLFTEGAPFAARPSTLENITLWMGAELLRLDPPEGKWASLTLWESEHLACVYRPASPLVTVRIRLNNLHLEITGPVEPDSGIVVDRAMVRRSVHECFVKLNEVHIVEPAAWSRDLFLQLQNSIQGLSLLQVDLGRHESLVVQS